MNERTWGYSGQVGCWDGAFPVPALERSPPLKAVKFLLSLFVPVLSPMHRPRSMRLSWAEYDHAGGRVATHEHVETSVSSWAAVQAEVDRLGQRTDRRVAVTTIFIDLDTLVFESSGESWPENAGKFQVSVDRASVSRPDEIAPDSIGIVYCTNIDVWVPTTYGPGGPRSNPDAAKNLPRLEAFLRDVAALVGGGLSADESRYYGDALTDTGFRDLAGEGEVTADRK